MFFKKKPKRLYYPSTAKWYTRPRASAASRLRNSFFSGEGRQALDWVVGKVSRFALAGAVLAVGLAFFIFSSYFSVTSIDIVRQDFNIDSAAIKAQLNDTIGKNIIFLSSRQIEDEVQSHFAEFSSVDVKKVFPHTLQLTLGSYAIVANLRAYSTLPPAPAATDADPKAPAATPFVDPAAMKNAFDLEAAAKPQEQKCLLNEVGQAIFDQDENPELMTVTIHDLTQPLTDRAQVIPRDSMKAITEGMQYFTNLMQKPVLGFEYLPVGREIHLKIDPNLILWISLERDVKAQIDKLNTIYEAAELNKEDLAYIDLRVKEKVIYCPRHAKCDR